ncbi:hypothetical protein RN001_014094 [Aquatica leii]|uniref:Bifunctional coenzyme A synthase n=1 Tax=Aquatica leii TaxID=1421715 RepID=A0AAN7P138_9COLE|nr:hypothetical protein RN001_014094 [Aquatica leii]
MLAKTALLIVSNPNHLGRILLNIHEKVKTTLYIQLLSGISGPFSFYPNVFTSWPKYSQIIWGIYSQAARHCQNLDVRVLLSALKYNNVSKIHTQNAIDLVIFDREYTKADIDVFLDAKIGNVAADCDVLTIKGNGSDVVAAIEPHNNKIYTHTVAGGTFDRLHIAHKLLLSEVALRSSSRVTVGVTDENMLQSKTLYELVEPLENRLNGVKDFMMDVCPELNYTIVPIRDLYGPTQHDPTMELIVVSAETIKGGHKINEIRQSKNLPILEILEVELIQEPYPESMEELKISSSTARMRLLGTLLNPPRKNTLIPNKPYVIGLTGGIASGKSSISLRLKELGAEIIDCDQVGHEMYKPGKRCYDLIVETFGKTILSENGEVNRKALGAVVFKSPEELQKLNNLVWPAIAEEVVNRIKTSSAEVLVVEAAVLLKASWEKYCHEIWTTIIPRAEAIQRLQSRNGLTQEQAQQRIASQCSNEVYTRSANVVFCSLWEREYTISQVNKAWDLLQKRLL